MEAEKIPSSPTRIKAMEDKINTDDLIEHMTNKISILERCNQCWVSLLKGRKDSQGKRTQSGC